MSPSTHHDGIIIGAGPGGGTLAYKLLPRQERRFSWRDMEAAWAQLRKHHVRQILPHPQTIPVWNVAAAGIKAFRFAIRMDMPYQSSHHEHSAKIPPLSQVALIVRKG